MNKTLFITGGTGLLGREFLHTFSKAGYKIIALKRETSKTHQLPSSIEWVTGNLNDPMSYLPKLEQADLVIHSAANVSFNPARKKQIIRFNVDTTKDIVNACLQNEIDLLHVSSVATLGKIEDGLYDETSDFDANLPNTAYALSKYYSEMDVWRGIAEGLQAIIINPSIIVGIPAQWHESSGTFWQQIAGGFSYYPKGKTGFVDARDAAEISRKLYETEAFGERFIVNGHNKAYEEFFRQIHKNLGRNSTMKPIPKWVSAIAWRIAKLSRFLGGNIPFSKTVHKTMNTSISYSSDKVLNRVDHSFYPFEESVEWVTKQFKQHRDNE